MVKIDKMVISATGMLYFNTTPPITAPNPTEKNMLIMTQMPKMILCLEAFPIEIA